MLAIDLFSGCGGFSAGSEMIPSIKTIEAIDNNITAIETYNQNLGFGVAKAQDIRGYHYDGPRPDLVYGSPPCQGISVMGDRDPLDVRNSLLLEFVRIVEETQPYYFVLENVPNLISKPYEGLYQELLNGFGVSGYFVYNWKLNALNYGVPQNRQRLFIVGYKGCMNKPKLPKQRPEWGYQTVEGALGRLWGGYDKRSLELVKHTPEVIGRFRATPPGTKEPVSRFYRVPLEGPSNTITAHGRFIHPTAPRLLSVRECARLQSFPDSFEFPYSRAEAYRLIGNAVPPLMGRAVLESIATAYYET